MGPLQIPTDGMFVVFLYIFFRRSWSEALRLVFFNVFGTTPRYPMIEHFMYVC